MVVEKLSMEAIKIDPNEVYVGSIYSNKGDSIMKANSGNGFIDYKDLELAEQRLTNKIDVSEAKLTGKIETVESKLSGKSDTLSAKIDSQSKLLYWLMGIVSAGIIVPLVTMIVKLFIK